MPIKATLTLYLSCLLIRIYSNTFLAQYSRTTNNSINFTKLASVTGASNLLSRAPSIPFLRGAKTKNYPGVSKEGMLVASSISFPFPKALLEKLKMLQVSCFLLCCFSSLSASQAQHLQSCSKCWLWPCCFWGDCSFSFLLEAREMVFLVS